MSPARGIDPLVPAETVARVEIRELPHGLAAILIVGVEAKAATVARIARRQADRERQAQGTPRARRSAQSSARAGRRGGAA